MRRGRFVAGFLVLLLSSAAAVVGGDPGTARATPVYGGIRLVDAEGHPVSGVAVGITDGAAVHLGGASGPDGVLRIGDMWNRSPEVEALNGTVSADYDGLTVYGWFGGGTLRPTFGGKPTERADFAVTGTELLELAFPFDGPDGSISGTVTFSSAPDELAFGDVGVGVLTASGMSVRLHVPVTADGRYTVTGLPAGSYRVVFAMRVSCPVGRGAAFALCGDPHAPWGYATTDVDAVTLADGQVLDGVDVVLHPAARVRGSMDYGYDWGAQALRLQPTTGGRPVIAQESRGVFAVDVPPGSYTAEFGWVSASGFVAARGFVPGDAGPSQLTLTAGGLTTLVGPGGKPFSDVGVANPFWYEITWLEGSKITTGYSDGTFRPYGSVSRGAMAAFLYRAAGSPGFGLSYEPEFVDVPVKHPFYVPIAWLAWSEIAHGYDLGDGTAEFRPEEPIARDAMAAFLYRYKGSPGFVAGDAPGFTDVPSTSPFATEIGWLAAQGVTTGYPDGTYRPFQSISRDAMAAFLYRAYGG